MASTGNVFPTAGATVARGVRADWLSPGNVVSDNGSDTTCALSTTGGDYLVCSSFGFTIPTGATISGITVRVEASETGTGNSNYIPQLISDTTPTLIGAAKSAVTVSGSTKVISTNGGTTDLWSASLTPAIVNDSGFGVAIWSDDTTNTLAIDFVTIAVEYTTLGDDYSDGSWASDPDAGGGMLAVKLGLAALALSSALAWEILQQGNEDYTPPPGAPAFQDSTWIAIGTDYPPPVFNFTDEIVPQGEPPATIVEEVYWWQPQQTISVTFQSPIWAEDEVVPVAVAEETEWQVETPPLVSAYPLLVFTVPDDPVPVAVAEETEWQVYTPPLVPAYPLLEYLYQDEVAIPLQVENTDWDVYTPPLVPTQPLLEFQTPDEWVEEAVVTIVEEDYWFTYKIVEPVIQPLVEFQYQDERPILLQIENTEWQVWTPPLVPAKPILGFQVPDELPRVDVIKEGDYWRVLAIGEEPRPPSFWDNEDFPIAQVVTTEEDYWWKEPVVIVTPPQSFRAIEDEIPSPPPSFVERDQWWDLPDKVEPVDTTVFSQNEEIVPQPPVPFAPVEEYWFRLDSRLLDLTIVDWPHVGAVSTGVTLITIEEENWRVWTPPLVAAKTLYLPDPEQIPAGSLAVVTSGHGLGVGVPSRHVSTPVFHFWRQTEDLPLRLALNLEENEWSVYTPPLVAAQPLYLPDPEEYLELVVPTITVEEEDWKVWTPPLPIAQSLYLPDPEELSAGNFSTIIEEDYWIAPPIQPAVLVATLWNEDDQILPQIDFSEIDEEPWQVWTPALVPAHLIFPIDLEASNFVETPPPNLERLYIDVTTGQLYLAVQGTETGSPIRLIPL